MPIDAEKRPSKPGSREFITLARIADIFLFFRLPWESQTRHPVGVERLGPDMDASSKPAKTCLLHGGDLAAAEAVFGPHPQGWLDLSTGINPRPYDFGKVGTGAHSRLPQTEPLDALLNAARKYYGAPHVETVTAAPGTQALIQWLPRLRGASRVAVVGPTYGEHARAWQSAGHTVTEIRAPDQAGSDTDVLVLVNPNNPDGTRYAPDRLAGPCRRLASRGGWLIVDEAFCDVTPDLSLAANCGRDGLIILRSFGKFFGLAGVRLGFALSNPSLASRLSEALGPWAVSGPTLEIGAKALSDAAWIDETGRNLATGRRRLETLLQGRGLEIVGGTDLFTLARSDRAQALHSRLAEQGIWTRAFAENPEWIRFGQPGTGDDWQRLTDALAGWKTEAR